MRAEERGDSKGISRGEIYGPTRAITNRRKRVAQSPQNQPSWWFRGAEFVALRQKFRQICINPELFRRSPKQLRRCRRVVLGEISHFPESFHESNRQTSRPAARDATCCSEKIRVEA